MIYVKIKFKHYIKILTFIKNKKYIYNFYKQIKRKISAPHAFIQ